VGDNPILFKRNETFLTNKDCSIKMGRGFKMKKKDKDHVFTLLHAFILKQGLRKQLA